jgi:hypothetical protein
MLVRTLLFATALTTSALMAAEEPDSSAILFDDTRIHAYELQFYYPDWADSLLYYKNLPDEEYIPARMVCRLNPTDSVVLDSIGVRYKGNSSFDFASKSPKKPFKFRFDKYRDGQAFFGVKRLNFSNGAKDPTMMREKIAYDLIGRYLPAPRAAFATITIAGELIGLYTQVEQVDKDFLARHFPDNDYNLYKSCDNGSTLLYKGVNQSSYESEYELKTNDKLNDWSAFIGMLDKLNTTPDADFRRVVGGCLDLDNICRDLAFNMVLSNFDSYTGSGRNFYFYDDSSSGRFTLIPWDLNLSFGAYTNGWNVITADVATVSNATQRPLNRRILADDSLRQVYLHYIKEMIDGPAAADSITAQTARFRLLIDSLVQADSNKLHSYADFQKNIDSNVTTVDGMSRITIPGLRAFLIARYASLRSQLSTYQAGVIGHRMAHAAVGQVLSCRVVGSFYDVTISYAVPADGTPVEIAVYSSRGALLQRIASGKKSKGSYTCTWDTRGAAAGWYLVTMTTPRGSSRVPLTVLR